MVLNANIVLLKGYTRNITFGSTKFLGHLLGESLQASPGNIWKNNEAGKGSTKIDTPETCEG